MAVQYLDPIDGFDYLEDQSSLRHNITLGSSNTQISTSVFKYGVCSIDTTASTLTSARTNHVPNAFNFGAGQFTVEAWVYHNTHSATAYEIVMGNLQSSGTNQGWNLGWDNTNRLCFNYSLNGSTVLSVGAVQAPVTGDWRHVAVDRDGSGVIRVYYQGTVIASATDAGTLFLSSLDWILGNDQTTSRGLPGYIGGVRVTKGLARYAGAFTPPSNAWPANAVGDSSFDLVTLLLNMGKVYDGSTFDKRLRTLGGAGRAGRASAGDTLRLIASPAPTSVGNATWTSGSTTVTLAAAATLTVDNCDSAWTGVTNVTASTNVAAGNRKEGSASVSLVVLAAFTSGKMAYRTLPSTLDLSAYQQISLWFYANSAVTLGTLELRLCSDATGDVPVHTIPLTAQTSTVTSWRVVVKDFGAALSSSINSVSVYAHRDPGTPTLRLDNIIACKAASSPDSLTHLSLIGKNTVGEPEWWPILSIDGTTVKLGGANDIGLGSVDPRNYMGTTETVTTYKRQPLDGVNGQGHLPAFSSTMRVFPNIAGASAVLPYTLSGGWNRTDMSTQDGESWLTASHWAGSLISCSGLRGAKIDGGIGFAHCINEPVSFSGSFTCSLKQIGASGCGYGMNVTAETVRQGNYYDYGTVVNCSVTGVNLSIPRGYPAVIRGRRITGTYGTSSSSGLTVASVGSTSLLQVYPGKLDNNRQAGITFGSTATNWRMLIIDPVFADNGSFHYNGYAAGEVVVVNATMPVTGDPETDIQCISGEERNVTRFQKFNGNPNDHRHYSPAYFAFTDSSTRHSGSGVAWRVKLRDTNVTELAPVDLPLFKYLAAAGVPVTLSCWVRRASTALSIGIKIVGGRLAGIPNDTVALASGSADTWEQVSVTVTPTEDGVIEVMGTVYGTTSVNGWFDDWSAT